MTENSNPTQAADELADLITAALDARGTRGRMAAKGRPADYQRARSISRDAELAMWDKFYELTRPAPSVANGDADRCLEPGVCPDPFTGMPCNHCWSVECTARGI